MERMGKREYRKTQEGRVWGEEPWHTFQKRFPEPMLQSNEPGESKELIRLLLGPAGKAVGYWPPLCVQRPRALLEELRNRP